ncbi:hypothetical protein LU293_02070 [Moraxella nasovis]|uniref:hypothetical protein n=1 Tax=Moraxella nasovis TaxID=2904121 RepID=UPI001F61DA3A|nr:hypothetical protein [Moraxella nasovis]UNU73719.1 hypothetical protein LU293_02070 [Moraxella nasovis]
MKNGVKKCLAMAFLMIVADVVFVLSDIKMVSFLMCFFIGLFMNSVRMLVRANLSLLAKDDNQASIIGQYSAVSYTLFQAGASLTIGYILATSGNITMAQLFLPLMVVVVLILYVFWTTKINTNRI